MEVLRKTKTKEKLSHCWGFDVDVKEAQEPNEYAPKGQCRNLSSKTNKVVLEYKSKHRINMHEYILMKIWLNKLISAEETNLCTIFPNIFVNTLPSRKWSITPHSLSVNYLEALLPEGRAIKRDKLNFMVEKLTNHPQPGGHSEHQQWYVFFINLQKMSPSPISPILRHFPASGNYHPLYLWYFLCVCLLVCSKFRYNLKIYISF